jgi:rhodanese-related sulfurtransferase
VARFAAEKDKRTLYLLDVRSPDEYAAGTCRRARSAPGGQLVQTTDSFVAVRNSRLVLIDDHGVRATMTASWLIQMGGTRSTSSTGALASAAAGARRSAKAETLGLDRVIAARISMLRPQGRARAQGGDRHRFSRASRQYGEAHIPGAWHAIRANLAQNLKKVAIAGQPRADLAGRRDAALAAPMKLRS